MVTLVTAKGQCSWPYLTAINHQTSAFSFKNGFPHAKFAYISPMLIFIRSTDERTLIHTWWRLRFTAVGVLKACGDRLLQSSHFYHWGERTREMKVCQRAQASISGRGIRTVLGISHHTLLLLTSHDLVFTMDVQSLHTKSHSTSRTLQAISYNS